ncbi:MAG: GYF domain-containing protein [Aeoliella sp.]
MAAKSWYVNTQSGQTGPHSSRALRDLATSGEINRDTLIVLNGGNEWVPAGNVQGLFDDDLPLAELAAIVDHPIRPHVRSKSSRTRKARGLPTNLRYPTIVLTMVAICGAGVLLALTPHSFWQASRDANDPPALSPATSISSTESASQDQALHVIVSEEVDTKLFSTLDEGDLAPADDRVIEAVAAPKLLAELINGSVATLRETIELLSSEVVESTDFAAQRMRELAATTDRTNKREREIAKQNRKAERQHAQLDRLQNLVDKGNLALENVESEGTALTQRHEQVMADGEAVTMQGLAIKQQIDSLNQDILNVADELLARLEAEQRGHRLRGSSRSEASLEAELKRLRQQRDQKVGEARQLESVYVRLDQQARALKAEIQSKLDERQAIQKRLLSLAARQVALEPKGEN